MRVVLAGGVALASQLSPQLSRSRRRPLAPPALPAAPACRRPAQRSSLECTAARTSAIKAKQRRTATEQRERGAVVRPAAQWENNPFAVFCSAARAHSQVCELLDVLEEPLGLDPNMVLLCLWLPVGCSSQLSIQNVHELAKTAARWRLRVHGALEVAAASLQSEDVAGLETAALLYEQIKHAQDRALVAAQSALFEQVGTLGGLPHPPSALGGASSQAAATHQLAAANLKLYLEYSGAALEARSRERLQVVFTTVLTPHTGVEPDLPSIWPLVEPTVVPVRRLELLERNKRYRLAKRAFALAMDSWKSATSLYRRTRRRMRAFRHEAYRARRAVRQEWR